MEWTKRFGEVLGSPISVDDDDMSDGKRQSHST